MSQNQYHIRAGWHNEVKVWYTVDTNVPRLVVEAADLNDFMQIATELAQDLLISENNLPIHMLFASERNTEIFTLH